MTISQSVLPEFDQEMANTRKLLALVPDDQLSFKPHEKSWDLARLAGHVCEMAGWAKTTLEVETLNMKSEDMKPAVVSSREELLTKFDADAKASRALIEGASDEDWSKIWRFIWDGKTIFEMPRIACYRGMVMNHMIHHRAQLGVYLRLCNIEIPGMYGPSADEMKFWKPETAATTA
jgi:uncharacterized damage-inducible protein DinB